MQTTYKLRNVPERYGRDTGDPRVAGALADHVTAAGAIRRTGLQQKAGQKARREAKKRVLEQFEAGRLKFTADTQPRDNAGKFRRVLARLKMNLGDAASEQLAKEMEEAAAAGAIGNYSKAKEHGANVVALVDEVQDGDIEKGTIRNIRKGAQDLGKLLAYLPLPQGDTAQKVRFSDLPAPTSQLIKKLIDRVQDRLDADDAAKYTQVLQSFMSGGRTMSADEMAAELSKILRVLA